MLVPLVVLILVLGFYPGPVLDVINPSVAATMTEVGLTDPVGGRCPVNVLDASYVAPVEQVTAPPIDWRRDRAAAGRARRGVRRGPGRGVPAAAPALAGPGRAQRRRARRWPVSRSGSTPGRSPPASRRSATRWPSTGRPLPLGHAARARAGQRAADRGPLGRAGRRVRGVGGVPCGGRGSAAVAYDPTDPDRSYGSPDQAPTMQTEVFPLALFALGGMMIFVAANDLLTMFIALEVLSLPLYLMCGLARRRRLLSQEAAVKYFLLGAFASAFFLYGLALLYGYAGSVRFTDIAIAVGRLGAVGHAAVRRPRAAGRRPAVQGLGRPVPHLDPGRLPGRADAGHRVHGRLHQGRRVRRDPAGAAGGVRRHPLGVAGRAVGRRRSSRW